MATRRDFLKSGSLLALSIGLGLADKTAAGARPYGKLPMIDGASGVDLGYLAETDPAYAVELKNIRQSGLSAVILTLAPSGRFWLDDAAYEATKKNIEKWRTIIAKNSRELLLVETADDIRRAQSGRRLGIIFGFQGTEPLGEDIERIPQFRQLGLRVIQLTHNRRNLVGDGAAEPGNAGLSQYGRQVVEQLNANKILVDLAHGSQRTTRDAILASKAPVLISHTGCRALADLPRNTDDAELRAMAERGGVAGIIFWPYLRTDTQPMAADVVRHIEHAINVCGEDHVGIGTDSGISPVNRTPEYEKDNREYMRGMKEDGIFAKERPDELYTFIPDLNYLNRFELLGKLLSKRGHSGTRIEKILGGNFARVMHEVWA